MNDGWGFDWTWLRPAWLLWLLPALAIVVWGHWRSLSHAPRWQGGISLLLRLAVITCLTLALTGVTYLQPTARQMIVVAVDRSASVDTAARETADRFLDKLRTAAERQGDTTLRLLPFAATPETSHDLLALDAETRWSLLKASPEETAETLESDLAAALRTADATIPPSYVPRIVLLSDGRSTTGDPLAAADRSLSPIWTVPLPARSTPEVQVAAVEAPAEVRPGQPFELEVVLNANNTAAGYVDLFRDDVRVSDPSSGPLRLQPGENRLRFTETVGGQSRTQFTARVRGLEAGDTLLENNQAAAIVQTASQPRVLLIDADVEQIAPLRWALEEQKIQLEVRPPAGLPDSLNALQRFDALVLSNVPATALSQTQMENIGRYVKELGGGFVMLGGDQAFGLGGYYQSHLEQVLPVRTRFEKEREKPSLAMVLVIDKSGSMGGERIALAKEAARAAVELLGPRDQIGILAFDGESYWVSDLQPAGDSGSILDRIHTIDASGGTNMFPAMDQAYQSLLAANAKIKHCLVLTDGQSSPADFEGLAGDMAAAQITVSTVALGAEASTELLRDIARLGQGRYYFCNDPQSVPQVFAKETMEASQSAINELPFLPISLRSSPVLAGIDLERAPFLLGYVVTRAKPTSEVILASESGDPLLAWWRYGLGMSVAFTSDAKSRWAAEWLAWPDFAPFWAQVLRHAMRPPEAVGMHVALATEAGVTRVRLETVDPRGRFVNDAETRLTVIDPTGARRSIPLLLTAPGRYEASLPSRQAGPYELEFMQRRDGAEPLRQSRSFVRGYPEELRLRPPDRATLRQLASLSGGQFDASPKAIVAAPPAATGRKPQPLWPWLLMAALTLFVIDVAVRRLPTDRRDAGSRPGVA